MPRPVTILTTGGTIAMSGDRMAVPGVDGEAMVAAVPSLAAVPDLEVESICEVASSHLDTPDALFIAQAALRHAARGRGVVVTHGTDTMEETAYLTDVMYGGDAPIVFTGAIRPASAPGPTGRRTWPTPSRWPRASAGPGSGSRSSSRAASTPRATSGRSIRPRPSRSAPPTMDRSASSTRDG